VTGPAAPHPVRVPQAGSRTERAVRLPRGASAPGPPLDTSALGRRENRAGTLRAVRVSLFFVLAVVVLFAVLVSYARAAPGGTSSGTAFQLDLFAVVAVAVAAGGSALSLGSAPRAIEVRQNLTVVVGRFGGRRRFPALPALSVRLVRRFPRGLLSPEPVEVVEVTGGRFRATYFLGEGLLPVTEGGRPPER